MKFNRLFVLLPIICLCFTACIQTPNMTALLAYEHEALRLTLHIMDETEFSAILTLDKEKDVLTFTNDDLSGIGVEFEENGAVHLSYEDYKIPLPNASLLKAIRWKEHFHLSEKNLLWKIEKETLGGLTVYTCKAEDIVIHIDAMTHLPLKITQGNLIIDVLNVQKLSCAESEE